MTSNNLSLFPETSPICFGENHFRFIQKCLQSPEGILQKNIVNDLGLDKTTVSEIKHDLIRLGWTKDVDLGSGKEVTIKICKENEIKLFLGQWQSLKHSIFVRPHAILCRTILSDKPDHFEKAANNLTTKYHVIISEMKNNKEYSVETDYGKIVFRLKGKVIDFWIEEFILPVYQEDVTHFEEYIKQGIMDRFFKLHSLFKGHFGEFRIVISDCFYLKSLHLGIITKENVNKVLSLRELDIFADKSIYGCVETETKGKIDGVLDKIKIALNLMFERKTLDK